MHPAAVCQCWLDTAVSGSGGASMPQAPAWWAACSGLWTLPPWRVRRGGPLAAVAQVEGFDAREQQEGAGGEARSGGCRDASAGGIGAGAGEQELLQQPRVPKQAVDGWSASLKPKVAGGGPLRSTRRPGAVPAGCAGGLPPAAGRLADAGGNPAAALRPGHGQLHSAALAPAGGGVAAASAAAAWLGRVRIANAFRRAWLPRQTEC